MNNSYSSIESVKVLTLKRCSLIALLLACASCDRVETSEPPGETFDRAGTARTAAGAGREQLKLAPPGDEHQLAASLASEIFRKATIKDQLRFLEQSCLSIGAERTRAAVNGDTVSAALASRDGKATGSAISTVTAIDSDRLGELCREASLAEDWGTFFTYLHLAPLRQSYSRILPKFVIPKAGARIQQHYQVAFNRVQHVRDGGIDDTMISLRALDAIVASWTGKSVLGDRPMDDDLGLVKNRVHNEAARVRHLIESELDEE
ncbi:hypothetical protein [Planctomycetes bacterium Poly30]|uniref:hypothetical protein n=1 Tax=Saltatorellus ferox TaxID=2528018 RepID=UPI0011A11E7B